MNKSSVLSILSLIMLFQSSAFAGDYCLGQATIFAKERLSQSISQQQSGSNLNELIKHNTRITSKAMASSYDKQNQKLNTVYSIQLSYQPPTQLQARAEQIEKPWQSAVVKNMQIVFQTNSPTECSVETAQVLSNTNSDSLGEASKAAQRAQQALKSYGLEQ